jgi:4,5-DOPA dioxygenase extradiol
MFNKGVDYVGGIAYRSLQSRACAARRCTISAAFLPARQRVNKLHGMSKAPVLFVSHGAPTFAVQPDLLGPGLARLGEQLTAVRAALVVSAHWQTPAVRVMRTASPETIHDFGGFPPELYQLQYRAPGAPAVAAETARVLISAGYTVSFDDERGLDHGAWVPLRYLIAKANVPVLQVSMPYDLSAEGAVLLGNALAPLRGQGVMLIGSGSLTHNLYEIGRNAPSDVAYAQSFAAWVRLQVERRDAAALADYRRRAPSAERAHPTEEHFLPLLVAVGASDDQDSLQVIDGGMTYGILSMESYGFGFAGSTG